MEWLQISNIFMIRLRYKEQNMPLYQFTHLILFALMEVSRMSCHCVFVAGLILMGFFHDYGIVDGAPIKPSACFKTIFQFGDSLSDTGNAARAFPEKYGSILLGFPYNSRNSSYGQTYFGRPSGRLSDGRLLVDFLAQSMKIAFLEPYLRRASANFSQGVDFSVAEATASNTSFMATNGISTNHPVTLQVQYGWYKNLSQAVYTASQVPGSAMAARLPSVDSMKNALYVIGPVGHNDYYYALSQGGKTIQQVTDLIVPNVVRSILDMVEGLYKNGARNFLLIGNAPGGCSPIFLTEFNGTKDSYGCLEEYNTIYDQHRMILKREVKAIRFLYADSQIIFADYFDAYMNILNGHEKYGFKDIASACCGAAGVTYNYDPAIPCSKPGSTTCNSTDHHIYWDEINFTDAFNNLSATKFTSGQYLNPTIQLYCQL